MKVKKMLSVLLVLVMILGITPTIAAAETSNNLMVELPKIASAEMPQFSDIPNDWSKAAMEKAVSNRLLTGSDGKIMSQEHLTRAQLATILNRAFGSSQKASLAAFADVKEGAWYYDEMAKAVSMGTFQGTGGKLSPESVVTRQEVFTVLARAFRLPSGGSSVLSKFSDSSSVSSWAQSSVSALAAAGYINGTNGKLNPAANITRAEFAQIMDNMIKGYITNSQTVTKVPDGNIMINAAEVTLKGVTINGDLIIGDGVGDGNATLDGVTVTGRILVRGGGVNSIKIIGASEADSLILARSDGKVRVTVSEDSKIQVIEIDDGSDDVFVEGTVSSISVMAEGITVTANNAHIGTVSVTGRGSKIVVGASSSIGKLKLDAEKTEAQVAGAVDSIEATKNAVGAGITGAGRVPIVLANANDVRVETPNTTVTAGPGVKGVTNNGKPVASGSTVSTPGSSSGGGGGNSNNGGGDSSDIKISDLNVSANKNSNIVTITANVSNAASNATAVITLTGKNSAPPHPAGSAASYEATAMAATPSKDKSTYTYSDIPIVQGKINTTLYGGILNDTYTVKITVGTVTATKSDIVIDAEIELYEYSVRGYPLSDFGTGTKGLPLIAYDNQSLDPDLYSEYTYDIIAFNLVKGTSGSLLSSQPFTKSTFEAFQLDGFSISCNSPDFFDSAGAYAIVMRVSLNGTLAGEAGRTISILPNAPDVSIDAINESISGYNSSTMEYVSDENYHAAIWNSDKDLSAVNSLSDMIPSDYPAGLYIRIKSTKSAAAYIELPLRPSAPIGLSASGATSASSADGIISGLDSDQGYQYKLSTASSWTDAAASATEISGLLPGAYFVRLKSMDGNFASRLAAVTVLDRSVPALTAPSLESAVITEADTKVILLKFSKAMSENGIDAKDFTLYGKSRNPDEGYRNTEKFVSAVSNPNDPSMIILTTRGDLRADYTYFVTYASGTTMSADGAVLQSFSDQPVDNQQIYKDLSIILGSDASNINYQIYGMLYVKNLQLGDGGSFNNSYSYGYQVCSDSSTTAPAPGTRIDEISGVKTGPGVLNTMAGNDEIKAGRYLVMYVYDEDDNDVIYGFGQIQIQEENIGKGWGIVDLTHPSDYSSHPASIYQTEKVLSVILPEGREIISSDPADLVKNVDTTDPHNPIYTIDISSISITGGSLDFALTVRDTNTGENYVCTLNINNRL
ncbi:S-layer homology domain-containing protein [Anoxybacterium hadale]|uniref:S-layer homology domain-containing protein n=1 Tax=Anoxybacterium hadale TaxID=3408580 RepID=UPI003AFF95B3